MCLEKLKNRIEKMSKHHQIEVLRLLMKFENINKNSNNNGTFVNLSKQTPEVIKALEDYADYVDYVDYVYYVDKCLWKKEKN